MKMCINEPDAGIKIVLGLDIDVNYDPAAVTLDAPDEVLERVCAHAVYGLRRLSRYGEKQLRGMLKLHQLPMSQVPEWPEEANAREEQEEE